MLICTLNDSVVRVICFISLKRYKYSSILLNHLFNYKKIIITIILKHTKRTNNRRHYYKMMSFNCPIKKTFLVQKKLGKLKKMLPRMWGGVASTFAARVLCKERVRLSAQFTTTPFDCFNRQRSSQKKSPVVFFFYSWFY